MGKYPTIAIHKAISNFIAEETTTSYEDNAWRCEPKTAVEEDDSEANLLIVKERLESYANSLFAFQVKFTGNFTNRKL